MHPDAGPELGGHLTVALETDPTVEAARMQVGGHLEACRAVVAGEGRGIRDQPAPMPWPWCSGSTKRSSSSRTGPAPSVVANQDGAVGGDGHAAVPREHLGVGQHERLGVGQQGRRVAGVRQRGAPEEPAQHRRSSATAVRTCTRGPVSRSRRRGCRRRCRPSSARSGDPCGGAPGAVRRRRGRRRPRPSPVGADAAPCRRARASRRRRRRTSVGSSRWADTGLRPRAAGGGETPARVGREVLDGQRVGAGAVVARGAGGRGPAAPAATGAVLAHRRHEVDRLVRRAVGAALLDPAVGVDVVDVEVARRGARGAAWGSRRRGLLAEPAGLVVGGGDRPAERLVAPGRGALASAGGEGQGQRPDALVVAGGVPLDVVAVDAAVAQPLGDPLGEGDRAARPGCRRRTSGRSGRRARARRGPDPRSGAPSRRSSPRGRRPPRWTARDGSRACTSRGRRPPSISIWSWPSRGRSRRAAARSASSRVSR